MITIRKKGYYTDTMRGFAYVALLLCMYMVNNLGILTYFTNRIVMIILWSIIFIGIYRSYNDPIEIKRNKVEDVYIIVAIIVLIYIVGYFTIGILDGFGKSPYDRSFVGILFNLLTLFTATFAREFIRGRIIFNLKYKSTFIFYLCISLLFTLISFELKRYVAIENIKELTQFVSQYLLPEVMINYLACILVALAGPFTAIIYILGTQTIEWILPVLPNLKWISKALIGILYPVFIIMYLEYTNHKHTKSNIRERIERENPVYWAITSIVSIMIVWFSVGVFPVYPSAVVTGSMEPSIQVGDMLLIKKMASEEDIRALQIGDVIQFRKNDIDVSHRVMEIYFEKGLPVFITKGDNNNAFDRNPIEAQNVRGIIVGNVPKVGTLKVLLASRREIDLSDI